MQLATVDSRLQRKLKHSMRTVNYALHTHKIGSKLYDVEISTLKKYLARACSSA